MRKQKIMTIVLLSLAVVTSGGWGYTHYTNEVLTESIEKRNKIIDKKTTEIAKLENVIVIKDDKLDAEKLVIEKQKDQLKKKDNDLKKKTDENKLLKDKIKKNKSINILKDSRGNNTYHDTMIVTAYTSGVESTGKQKGDKGYGITASGTNVKEGRTISCSKDIPFGTVIEIESVGSRVCEDTGSAITSGRIDLYIENLDEARNFGVKRLRVNVKR